MSKITAIREDGSRKLGRFQSEVPAIAHFKDMSVPVLIVDISITGAKIRTHTWPDDKDVFTLEWSPLSNLPPLKIESAQVWHKLSFAGIIFTNLQKKQKIIIDKIAFYQLQ